MKPKRSYLITLEREDDWWLVSAPEIRGCHTQGRTLEQARERIREAIQVCLDLLAPFDGELVDDVKLPAKVRKVVESANKTRAAAAKWDARASRESREAIATLTSFGLSLRDAGALLGVTRQRAQKLKAG